MAQVTYVQTVRGWQWIVRDEHHNQIARSGIGYTTRAAAEDAYLMLADPIASGRVSANTTTNQPANS